MSKTLTVAVAVIQRGDNILVAQRAKNAHQGGLWEFPGGKKEVDETIEQALIRESHEELNIIPCKQRPLIRIEHQYSDKSVRLEVWLVTDYLGIPHGNEGQPLRWVAIEELHTLAFPEANKAIIELLQKGRT